METLRDFFCESLKMKSESCWRFSYVRGERAMRLFQGILLAGSGNSSREESMLQKTVLKGRSHLSPLTSFPLNNIPDYKTLSYYSLV